MGKDQARRETRNETRPTFRAGRNPQAPARLASRGEADEKSPPGRFAAGARPVTLAPQPEGAGPSAVLAGGLRASQRLVRRRVAAAGNPEDGTGLAPTRAGPEAIPAGQKRRSRSPDRSVSVAPPHPAETSRPGRR